jgi:WD40 repeat protein
MHLTGQLDPTHYMPIKFYFTGMAWSPHHHGLLVSGGGKNDARLHFWNVFSGKQECKYTGSQVCNIAWSEHSSQLVSNWHMKLLCSSIHEIVLLIEVRILFYIWYT